MKRKPIKIITDLTNILNGYPQNMEIKINEIKERTDIHWNTAKDYLYLIYFIQNLVPKLNISKIEEKLTISIKENSNLIHSMDDEKRFIIHLFVQKAFEEETAIFLETRNHEYLAKLEMEKLIFSIDGRKYFLRRSGKIRAKQILSNLYLQISNLSDNYGILSDGLLSRTPQKIFSPNKAPSVNDTYPVCYQSYIFSPEADRKDYISDVSNSESIVNIVSPIMPHSKIQSSDCA
ncbi:MAG: hypothetical protein ACTSRK_10305 [Promethearchaeota archaeon]